MFTLKMATAMPYPTAQKGGRGLKASATEGFSTSRLSYARTVLRDQALAERVLAGTLSLDDVLNLGQPLHCRALRVLDLNCLRGHRTAGPLLPLF
jgi:hypothetical protein